ncbi:Arm DNA-binding domain-containing protein [Zhongshania sp.]|uniref:Arm DNA-binding domain-containing protein n=1 Tax=Zhongshania sp. TaxID=1971902 RepID=UPI003566C932
MTDTALRKLKPNAAPFKVSDRDGMYVTVSKTGTITFRYDYRLNGRRDTLNLGRYRPLVLARKRLLDARNAVEKGLGGEARGKDQ